MICLQKRKRDKAVKPIIKDKNARLDILIL